MSDPLQPTEPNEPSNTVVSEIVPVSDQIGRNVMAALNGPNAVAVLTTLVPGVSGDRVVSMSLTDEQMHHVGVLLNQIQEEDEEAAADEERCIGFQCQLPKS